jgi:hypothetical protein
MKKIEDRKISNSDSKDKNKKFFSEIDDENCNCYWCREFKDQKRVVQRQNSLLGIVIGFGQ